MNSQQCCRAGRRERSWYVLRIPFIRNIRHIIFKLRLNVILPAVQGPRFKVQSEAMIFCRTDNLNKWTASNHNHFTSKLNQSSLWFKRAQKENVNELFYNLGPWYLFPLPRIFSYPSSSILVWFCLPYPKQRSPAMPSPPSLSVYFVSFILLASNYVTANLFVVCLLH